MVGQGRDRGRADDEHDLRVLRFYLVAPVDERFLDLPGLERDEFEVARVRVGRDRSVLAGLLLPRFFDSEHLPTAGCWGSESKKKPSVPISASSSRRVSTTS